MCFFGRLLLSFSNFWSVQTIFIDNSYFNHITEIWRRATRQSVEIIRQNGIHATKHKHVCLWKKVMFARAAFPSFVVRSLNNIKQHFSCVHHRPTVRRACIYVFGRISEKNSIEKTIEMLSNCSAIQNFTLFFQQHSVFSFYITCVYCSADVTPVQLYTLDEYDNSKSLQWLVL